MASEALPAPTENSGGTVGNLRPFRPGQSGNPGGRPKALSTLICEQTLDGRELVAFLMASPRLGGLNHWRATAGGC